MSRSIGPRILPLALVAAAAAACAPEENMDTPAPAQDPVTIVVQHDLPVATSLTVQLIDPSGRIRRLGTVPAGAHVTFIVPERVVSGDYRLVTETPDGRALTSPRFILHGRDSVTWQPSANVVVPEH